MARIRTIKPEFCSSADTGALSRDARLFFLQLLTEADDEGRMLWLPRKLAGVLYPFDEAVDAPALNAWAAECINRRMLAIYEIRGVQYMQVVNWSKHQRISHPTPSRLPACLRDDSGKYPEENQSDSRELPEPKRSDPEVLRSDLGTGNREQGEGKGEKPSSPDKPATPAMNLPIELTDGETLPSIPMKDGSSFSPSADQVIELKSAYPSLDLQQELQKMRAWALANPGKRKTARGAMKFVNGWLSNAKPTKPRTADSFRASRYIGTPIEDLPELLRPAHV